MNPCKHWFEGMVARSETSCPFCEIEELQTQLAERDKTILEQQARITSATEILLWDETRLGCDAYELLTSDNDFSALEAALKAERIKTLEDAIARLATTQQSNFGFFTATLIEMANELKEQS